MCPPNQDLQNRHKPLDRHRVSNRRLQPTSHLLQNDTALKPHPVLNARQRSRTPQNSPLPHQPLLSPRLRPLRVHPAQSGRHRQMRHKRRARRHARPATGLHRPVQQHEQQDLRAVHLQTGLQPGRQHVFPHHLRGQPERRLTEAVRPSEHRRQLH